MGIKGILSLFFLTHRHIGHIELDVKKTMCPMCLCVKKLNRTHRIGCKKNYVSYVPMC